jgi:hypothetical protein
MAKISQARFGACASTLVSSRLVGTDGPSEGRAQALKVDDHGPDAIRYGVTAARQVWRPWLGLVA